MVWGFVIVLTLLGVTAIQWIYFRPRASDTSLPDLTISELEIVAVGHVDGEFGVTALLTSIPGRVTKVLVKEGETVERGQTILELDDRQAKLRVEEALTAERAAQENLAQTQRGPSNHKLKQDQQSASIAAAQAKLGAARAQFEYRSELRRFNSITQAELDATGQLVREAEQLVKVEESRLVELNAVDPLAPMRVAEIQLESVKLKVEQARAALADCKLVAPQKGTILRMLVTPGDSLVPTSPQPPVLFLAEGRLIVRAEVEQEFSDGVQVGMEAMIQDDSRVGQTLWNGRVERLSDWVARRRSVVFEPGAMNDVRTLECIVVVEPSDVQLRVGQRVRVIMKPIAQ